MRDYDSTTMNCEIWNLLHDGSILGISGSMPGDVEISVGIEYLRTRFPDTGEKILLTLHGCTRLEYEAWDSGSVLTDPRQISAIQPQILSATGCDPVEISCDGGTLRIAASGVSLSLDSGRAISVSELSDVADSYWEEWSAKAPRNSGTQKDPQA